MPLRRPPQSARTHWFVDGGRTVVALLVGALISGLVGYHFSVKINDHTVREQQQTEQIQTFRETGSAVDAAITKMADATIDKSERDSARVEARQAIAEHAAATQNIIDVVGKGNADAYLGGLGTLRKLVDDTDGVQSAMTMSQARFDVMHNRTLVIGEAKKRMNL